MNAGRWVMLTFVTCAWLGGEGLGVCARGEEKQGNGGDGREQALHGSSMSFRMLSGKHSAPPPEISGNASRRN